MGYYMRYLVTDKKEVDLQLLEDALKQSDSAYSIANKQESPRNAGDLMYNNEIYGQVEINRLGDDLFNEEIEELREFIEDAEGKDKKKVMKCLRKARCIVAIQVLFQDRDTETTLSKINTLWQWLFANRKGLLQANGEGYYDLNELILEVE